MMKKITFNVPNLRYGLCAYLVFLLLVVGCGGTQGQNAESEIPPKAIRPEAKTPEAEALMKRGHLSLGDSDWAKAVEFFDRVLDADPEYAPAYIGLLCAELRVRGEELLGDYPAPISEHNHFKRAVRFADAGYKTKIEGFDKKIRERLKERFGDAGKRMTVTIKDVEYAFRRIPAGWFMMGSPADEPNRGNNESQRQVTLSKGFWMLETEVTQGMWMSVMGNNPSSNKGLNLPVTDVSWNDCQEYIKKLNELKVAPAGYKFSLPTEAQWEYACRAGTTTAYYFDDMLTQQQANFGGRQQTRDVGSYPANAWSLKDMHGNVWEWCQDIYGDYPSGAVTDPTGAERGSYCVLRGGSWDSRARYCRSAYRSYNDPEHRFSDLGLRLSLVLE